jgi:hypothetical protein
LRKWLIHHLGKSQPSPKRERCAQFRGGTTRIAGDEFVFALREQPFKALRVEFAVFYANEVSGSTRLQHSGTEYLAQPRDGDLKRLTSRWRRGLTPQHVNDLLGRHDLIGVNEKQAHKHFLSVPAEIQQTTLATDVERTENPKVHGASQ